jgi:hypothetical protein
MKREKRGKYNKNISLLLFMGFLLILMNNISFIHTHTLSDGTVILHAHPFHKNTNDDTGEKHHHSDFEYVVLKQLQIFYHEEFNYFPLSDLISSDIQYCYTEPLYISNALTVINPRAPPAIL